jgi:hypothetical protein
MSWLHKLLDPFNHSPWKAYVKSILFSDIKSFTKTPHHFHNIFCSYTYYPLFLSKDLTIWAGSRRVEYPPTPPFHVSTLIN